MYERSAIVLERYFENILQYRRDSNIRDNFNNYCDLVDKLEKYQVNYEREVAATQEFEESIKQIKVIQDLQEKLYKKSAKLEYNRNLIFGNIDVKVEETRKCFEKIEADVEKNNQEMKETKEKLLQALTDYNDKRFELSKCKRYKKMAENAYNETLEKAMENFEGINEDLINLTKAFSKFDDSETIINELQDNGKDEKIPFNEDVIKNATMFGIDIAKKEAAGYLIVYDKMSKLLADIQAGATKTELHKKYARNEKAKMDFIYAIKKYIVQFLDYERMTIIHGRKSHNRLMSEACENFSADVVQINNLFELLVKEITNKATKKLYKELYNKSYLIDIQEKEEKFKREKNRINLYTATLINSNYWRIEGIKEIYTIFYKNVSEVFGKSVVEFDMPKEETEEDSIEETEIYDQDVVVKEEIIEEKKEVAKIPFEINEKDKDVSDINEVKEKIEKENVVENEKEEAVENVENTEIQEKNKKESIKEKEKEKTAKIPKVIKVDLDEEDLEEDDTNDYYGTYDNIIDNVVEEFQEVTVEEEFDIFGEKYKDIDFTKTPNIKDKRKSLSLEEIEDIEDDEIVDVKLNVSNKTEITLNMDDSEEDDDILEVNDEKDDDESIFETNNIEEDDDESIFSTNSSDDMFSEIKPIKKKRKSKNDIEDEDISEETTSKIALKKIKKISNTKKKKNESNIW